MDDLLGDCLDFVRYATRLKRIRWRPADADLGRFVAMADARHDPFVNLCPRGR